MENKLNARELRVGNYLMDTMEDAGIIQVLEIREMSDSKKGNMAISYIGVKGGYCTTSLEEDADHDEERFIQPIPLTEDELVKLGFDVNTDYVSETHVWYDYVLNDVRISMPYFEFNFENGENQVEIKSVHQLQNLYYALTGTELTYNN